MSEPTSAHIAQLFGTASAAWLSGFIGSISITGVPAVVLAPPNVSARQWGRIYHIGHLIAPYIAVASSASFAYGAKSLWTALDQSSNGAAVNQVYLVTAAAVATISIVPWTLIIMDPTNDRLHAKDADAKAGTNADLKHDSEVFDLLMKWAPLNAGRATFPLIGAICGVISMTY